MRSFHVRAVAIAGLALLVATACSKPKKPDGDAAAAAATAPEAPISTTDQPVVQTKDSTLDPRGSDGGSISGLSTVFFEYDKANLTSDTRKRLGENAEWIKTHPAVTIQIEGHTDERGSVEYNLALGERRAKSVKAYLETLGVEGRRMTIISYGEEKPLASGSGESVWSKNRRANFVPLQ
jgi:peptidoglycan-associated lipoprotein